MRQSHRRMEDQKSKPVRWHLTRILLKREGLNQSLKSNELGDVLSEVVQLTRITDGDLTLGNFL